MELFAVAGATKANRPIGVLTTDARAELVGILREAERNGKPIGELCRQHGVSEQSFYRWRNKYGAMDVADVQRMRQLVQENARLKRIVAERDLEIDAMKDLLSKKW